MSLNPLDPRRDRHFAMLLGYFIDQFGEELGKQNYTEWLRENQYDDTLPMIKQRELKGLCYVLENRTHKHKDNPLQQKGAELLRKMTEEAMGKSMETHELYLYHKKIKDNLRDAELLSKFNRLGNNKHDPDPQDLRDLKRYYDTATQMSPSSIQAKSAKAIFGRTVERMIANGQATRSQIEKYL